jgi:predicted Zn-ribbon and HTH transcriptional regulator
MEYTWKNEDLVKTTRDLRHKTEPETCIPKDTIVQIIGIEQVRGYQITTLVSPSIKMDGITSNGAFQKLTDFEKELILEYDIEYTNELIRNRHVGIKTHEDLRYIEFDDLRVNSHCPECDSMYKWKSDYFMRDDEKLRKIRDSYGHYLTCGCAGRWIPTKRDLNINVGAKTYLRNYTEPSRGIADPLCIRARWIVHIKEPDNTDGKSSWWGIHYLKEYLEDNQELKADNKVEEVYILYNDFIRLKKNFGGIYALRVDKNRSRERFGRDGLEMSIYQIQMKSSPSFWSKYLALLISESVLCITRNGCIWKDVLPNNNLKKELDDKAEALITYRDKVLAHADSEIYEEIGVDDFLTRRRTPQTSKELLDALLEESHELYAEGLQEINKKFDLEIEPEIYTEYDDIEESIEPIGTGILTAPTDLLEILRMVEKSIIT